MAPELRAWQRMLSGRRLDLLDPSPLDIEIEDIAHGLARVARWNGQTKGDHAFSVAQHCLLVEGIASHVNRQMDRPSRLMALLHDAPEYVVGDMISPFKAALGLDYKAFEKRLLSAIHMRFMEQRHQPRLLVQLPVDVAGDPLHQHAMLRHGKGMVALGLAIPPGHPCQPMGDVLNLDIKRRGVQQVKPASRKHP